MTLTFRPLTLDINEEGKMVGNCGISLELTPLDGNTYRAVGQYAVLSTTETGEGGDDEDGNGSAGEGGTSTRSDEITPLFTTPTVSSAHVYGLDLGQGELIEATVTWEDPTTDLDLLLTGPASTCQVLPEPAVTCLLEGAQGTARSATCLSGPGEGQNVGLGPASESLDATAETPGVHELWVLVSTGVPNVEIHYSVSVTTDGDGHEGVDDGPEPIGLIRTDGHCRTP